MNELALFLQYVGKVFGFAEKVRRVRDRRPYPEIPTRAVFLSLILGVVMRFGSYLDLAAQTKRRRWQHLIHWAKRISHDTFGYVAAALYTDDLRQVLAEVNQQLKANKALESCKLHGLLFLSLDANEHFHSQSRCCGACCQREVEQTDAQGQKRKGIQYYHRYVFAQINGPKLNLLLDVEPIRPDEGEAEAALRLLGRICRLYGKRFFDGVTLDSWYVQGPFLKAVKKFGWLWIVVLKQERMEVFQEARALSRNQPPDLAFHDAERNRDVQLWRVKDLRFSDAYGRSVGVVHSREEWTETKIVGGKKQAHRQVNDWWWMTDEEVAGYPVRLAYAAGHRRWGIENKAFNELTQGYHLTHCYHHEAVAMLNQMLIVLLGFTLFTTYAVLHSQQVRLGLVTLKELAHDLDLALVEDLPWDRWFACG